MKSAEAMKPHHRVTGVNIARCCSKKDFTFWKRMEFSDEKKFNVDLSDGLAHYWHDLQKHERIFSNRQQGGDSSMIWKAILDYGILVFIVIWTQKRTVNFQKTTCLYL